MRPRLDGRGARAYPALRAAARGLLPASGGPDPSRTSLGGEPASPPKGTCCTSPPTSRAARRVRGVRRVTALAIGSPRLGIAGVADLVEFREKGGGEIAFPVEYKRGKPKRHRADEVQLCAQALCLEDMTGQAVPAGALFYAETKRRAEVVFDGDLRALTVSTIEALRDVFASRLTPLSDAATQPLPRLLARRSLQAGGRRPCRPRLAASHGRPHAGGKRRVKKLLEHRLHHHRRCQPSQGRREPCCRGGWRGAGARAVPYAVISGAVWCRSIFRLR